MQPPLRQHSCLQPPPPFRPTWSPILPPLFIVRSSFHHRRRCRLLSFPCPWLAFFAGVTLRLRVSPTCARGVASFDVVWTPRREPLFHMAQLCGRGDRRGGERRSSHREKRRRKKDSFDQCLLSVLLCRGGRRRKRYKYIYFQPAFPRSFAV